MSGQAELHKTPLHPLHVGLGGRMVAYAGYEMPLHYRTGILQEHLHTRAAAGLFDVSHMGQIHLWPNLGTGAELARALEGLVPADLVSLSVGRQRYALFTNEKGGIVDDLIVTNQGDHLTLVVNASRKDEDEARLRESLSGACVIKRRDDLALLALQGPAAESVLATLNPNLSGLTFMQAEAAKLCDIRCVVSRSGYTGEDGFEISVAADNAMTIARELLANPLVKPVGLGARDSLRLEAGLCLYGNDIDAATTPIEAALEWSIQKSRRNQGTRAGGFPGSDQILKQLEFGAVRRRVGLRTNSRTPVRGGTLIFVGSESQNSIGVITSGCFGPSVDGPVAMAYVESEYSHPGVNLFAEVRGKRIPVNVCRLPFVPTRYKRT